MIADGVGGAARGDVASSTAVQALRRLDGPPPATCSRRSPAPSTAPTTGSPSWSSRTPSSTAPARRSPRRSSTATGSALAHIGDSRGYLLRDGTLSQLTKDHTFVQSLIDEGRITEEESRTHPHRNLILRAVDGVHETDPDLFYIELAPGDRLLLCSDGASGVLDHDRLADILGTGSVDYAVVELIRASLEAGSSDNITCVVADVVDPGVARRRARRWPPPRPVRSSSAPPPSSRAAPARRRRASSAATAAATPARSSRSRARTPDAARRPRGAALRPAGAAPRPLGRAASWRCWCSRWSWPWPACSATAGARTSTTSPRTATRSRSSAASRPTSPGSTMNRVAEDTDVTIASLPDYPTEQVARGISADVAGRRAPRSSRGSPAWPGSARRPPRRPTPPSASRRRPPTAQGVGQATAKPSASPRAGATVARATAAVSHPDASPSAAASPTLAPPDCIEATP